MKMFLIFILVVQSAMSLNIRFYDQVNSDELEMIKKAIEDKIVATVDEDGVKTLIPGLPRLAFHDCIGGCDGCINYSQEENRGLQAVIEEIETVYSNPVNKIFDIMSRADFWAYAAQCAIHQAIHQNNEVYCVNNTDIQDCHMPPVKFWYRTGRVDCVTSPENYNDFEDDLPSADFNNSELNDWWMKNFRLHPNNGVALMGLHSLGKAGGLYSGTWDKENPDGLNNRYFMLMEDKCNEWHQVQLPSGKFQWVGKDGVFGLNADICQFKDFNLVNGTGQADCKWEDCGRARKTAGMLSRYASDINNWATNLRWTFSVVLENGYRLHGIRSDD